MKTFYAFIIAVNLILAGFLAWMNYYSMMALHEAAVAMRAASDDYRSSYQEYLGEKSRIASMLEQFSKDATRMRAYLQRKGG